MPARYDRAPTLELLQLLEPGNLLAPMVAPPAAPLRAAGLPLDLQFREHDEVHLYCGLTRLVCAKRSKRGGHVSVSAYTTYQDQPCSRALFRRWAPSELGFRSALSAYLENVVVNSSLIGGEGRVQATWMQLHAPWYPVDREGVIGGSTSDARDLALDAPLVQRAFRDVDQHAASEGWARPVVPKQANEADVLGLDATGSVVICELKKSDANDIQYAPLQVQRYVCEWSQTLATVLSSIDDVVAAKAHLGLLPANAPRARPALRVAVAWGEGDVSAERFRRLRKVREIVNQHLPDGVAPIEVWKLTGGGPTRIL